MTFACRIVREAVAASAEPPPDEPIWRWCERHIVVDKTSPMPGPWRLENSPWTKDPLEAFQRDSVNVIVIQCARQTAKTQTFLNASSWVIPNAPGPMLWAMATEPEAKTFGRVRLMPTWRRCPPVARLIPEGRSDSTTTEVNFDSMPFILQGAQAKSKMESKPQRYLFLDEIRNYPAGALELVEKTVTMFWNHKRVMIGSPKATGDAMDTAFQLGDQQRYLVACPHCGGEQELRWREPGAAGMVFRMRWDETLVTRPGGRWNYNRLAETIRYECKHCGKGIPDRPDVRWTLARSGRWVRGNLDAPNNYVSFTWSALIAPWVRWADLAKEFLQAMDTFQRGVIDPLQSFVTDRLGEPWNDVAALTGFDLRRQRYEIMETWPEEFIRFLTIDVQDEGVFWCVVRAWKKTGESRRLYFGRLLSWTELRAKQQEFKVADNHVLCDAAFNSKEVYLHCVRFGWIALWGEQREEFLHPVMRAGKHAGNVRRSYSAPVAGDPEKGEVHQGRRFAPLVRWSVPTIAQRLKMLRAGRALPWLNPDPTAETQEIEDIYSRQMASEYQKLVADPKTQKPKLIWVCPSGNNHASDCERMQVVAATLASILPDTQDELTAPGASVTVTPCPESTATPPQ